MKDVLKKEVLEKLSKIKLLADSINLKGNIELSFTGVPVSVWDDVLNSIIEYPKYNHVVEVAEGLNVYILLD